MSQRSRLFSLFLLLVLVAQTGCFGNSDPVQTAVNRGVRDLALTGRTFSEFFENNLKSCDDFFEIYNALSTEVQDCDNEGGSFQLSKGDVSCEDGPPLLAIADFTLSQSQCKDDRNKVTNHGELGMTLSFSAEGNLVFLDSALLIVNDIPLTFDDFEVRVNFANKSLSCDGGLLVVDGEDCNIGSDCKKCNL